jgi:hypothetical protein
MQIDRLSAPLRMSLSPVCQLHSECGGAISTCAVYKAYLSVLAKFPIANALTRVTMFIEIDM